MNENVGCFEVLFFFLFLRPCPSSYISVLKFNVKFDLANVSRILIM